MGRLLYLHGFLSGPASRKAQDLHERMRQRGLGDSFACPQLPVSPKAAIALTESLLAPGTTVVGSSLGGYYATWLCARHPALVRGAVLVNPAVLAHVSLERYLGPQKNLYTGEAFDFTPEHIAEMRALEINEPKRDDAYWLLVEEGDEILDYRQAVAKYPRSRQTLLSGGNHTFSRWHDYLDAVIDFADLG
ncbi:MAG: esterase [Rhodocyclaceae bacterium]|nr:esterase [Rhodocyclaceae bacterium]